MYDEKKKKEEKKDEIPSIMTKDSVKKEDDKKEEKPDMRSKYAMINLIKQKLRAAGQRDPMVMAVDACEERTPAQGDDSFKEFRKGGSKFRGDKSSSEVKGSEPEEKPDKGADTVKNSEPVKNNKPIKPKKEDKPKPPYNPYGKDATANPSNMSVTTGS